MAQGAQTGHSHFLLVALQYSAEVYVCTEADELHMILRPCRVYCSALTTRRRQCPVLFHCLPYQRGRRD